MGTFFCLRGCGAVKFDQEAVLRENTVFLSLTWSADMAKQLMEIVLPRLARPLYQHLEELQLGRLSEVQFNRRFEKELQKQHHWLAQHGIEAARAAIAIHAAVIVLSLPGL